MKSFLSPVVIIILLVKQNYATGSVDYGDDVSDRNAYQNQQGFHKYLYSDRKDVNQYDEAYDNVLNEAYNPAINQQEHAGVPSRLNTLNIPFSLRSLAKETQLHEKPTPRPTPGSRTSLNRFLSQPSQSIRDRDPNNPGVEWGQPPHADATADPGRIQSNYSETNGAPAEELNTNIPAAETQFIRGKRHERNVDGESDGERQQRASDVNTADTTANDAKTVAINILNPSTDKREMNRTVLSPPEVQSKTADGWSDNKDTFQDHPESAETVNNSNKEKEANIYEVNLNLEPNSNASLQSNYITSKINAEVTSDSNNVRGGDDDAANTFRKEEEELKKYILRTVSNNNNTLGGQREYSLEQMETLLADLSNFRQHLLHNVLYSREKSPSNVSIENILRPMLNYMIGSVIRNLLFILAADTGSMANNPRFYEPSNHQDSLETGKRGPQTPRESTAKVHATDQNLNYPHPNKITQFVDRSYGYPPEILFADSPYQHQPAAQDDNPNMEATSSKGEEESVHESNTLYDPQWRATAYDEDVHKLPKNRIFDHDANRVEEVMRATNLESRDAIPYLYRSNQNRLSQIDPLSIPVEESRGYPKRSNRRLTLDGSNMV